MNDIKQTGRMPETIVINVMVAENRLDGEFVGYHAMLDGDAMQAIQAAGISAFPLGRARSKAGAVADLIRRANMDCASKNIVLSLTDTPNHIEKEAT